MIWIDAAFRAAAVASTIIATLRAGSRVTYLLKHDGIGIMDGPVIQNSNTNETTYPLFELSEAFRHSVRLSMAPQFYQNVRNQRYSLDTVSQPYLLSPQPYKPRQRVSQQEGSGEKSEVNSFPEVAEAFEKVPKVLKSNRSFLSRKYALLIGTVKNIPFSIISVRDCLSMIPRAASFWSNHKWTWKQENAEGKHNEHENEDWDWSMSVDGELLFNSTTSTDADGIPETTTRVAELSVFAPKAFAHLRNSIFGVEEAEYRQSIFGSGPFVSFQSNSKGAARVGGVFFFTRDGAYMIKTIKNEEAKTFLNMLPKYHKHMSKFGKTSLLTRFCGMYGVRIHDKDSSDDGKLHTFVVMNAAFPAEASRFISERFDLKGSTVGREVSEDELKKKGSDAVLKDLDLAREVEVVKAATNGEEMRMTKYGLNIGPLAKAALLAQLREDVKLLVECQVMDYSLLVGVVDMETFLHFDRSVRKAFQSVTRVGRRYSTSKKVEERALWAMGAPIRLLTAPPAFLVNQALSIAHRTLASIVTLPLPYYGSGNCGVDGGLLSVFHGTRNGKRALYYMGLIDFLQPWTTRKVLERNFKGLLGQDVKAISCVTPEEYADRFLAFLEEYIS